MFGRYEKLQAPQIVRAVLLTWADGVAGKKSVRTFCFEKVSQSRKWIHSLSLTRLVPKLSYYIEANYTLIV